MEVCGKRADIVAESCELCLIEGLSTEADGYCNECDEYMCNKCFQHHIKAKSCRNHVLSPLGQSVQLSKKQTGSNEKCKTHVNENVKYYCRKHDMVTCGDCVVGDHQGCKIEFISTLADKFENSSEFIEIVTNIKKLEAEQKENKTKIDNNRKENKKYLDTALAEIKKFRKYINEHLDKIEKEIIFEANLAKQNDDMIDELEKMLFVAEQDIDDIRNTLDANKIQGETLFIRTKEYTAKLSKVNDSISFIRTNNVIKWFAFAQEKQLADMIKSGVKLGCFRRDTVTQKETGVIQKIKQPIETSKLVVTNVTADKQVEAKQSHLLTDPRAAGFEFDSFVMYTQGPNQLHGTRQNDGAVEEEKGPAGKIHEATSANDEKVSKHQSKTAKKRQKREARRQWRESRQVDIVKYEDKEDKVEEKDDGEEWLAGGGEE